MIFWLILRGFWFTSFYALWVILQSSTKLNVLWRCIIVVSFISVAFVLSSYKSSNVFVAKQHPWNGPFCGVSAPSLLQIWLELANISTRGTSFIRQRQSLNNLFKIKCLSRNGTYPKLMVLVHFGPNLPPENPKYCQKTQNTSPKS